MKASYKIGSLYAEAYNSAIRNVIALLNETMGTKFFYARDWAQVDALIEKLGIRFDIDGEIIKEV